jgi:hypothetical protein
MGLSRRAFASTAPLLAATLIRCSNAIFDRTRFAEAFVIDPDWTAYRPILRGIVTAIAAFDRPGFPLVSASSVEDRLIAMFPLDRQQRFLGLQRTLVLFNQLDLFDMFSGPLIQEEQKARDISERGGDMPQVVAQIREADGALFRTFVQNQSIDAASRFEDLALEPRRAYLALWRDSGSVVKRQFYGALKSIVLIATYSMDATWPAIGYKGPLLR